LKTQQYKGFTLIEILVTVAIIAILARLALPSYQSYVVKSARTAAQTELLQLANLQEKIYLNASRYSASVTNAYNGTSAAANGLGSSANSKDGKYTFSMATPADGQSYTLTASPVPGKAQEGDGDIRINQSGQRIWGSASW
jgi:type IV pilus assembly protein PilE